MSYIYRTSVASPTNTSRWVFSAWIKRSAISNSTPQGIISTSQDNTNYAGLLFNNSNDKFYYKEIIAGSQKEIGSGSGFEFRDTNAWYHIFMEMDSSQATDTNRTSLWINGVNIGWGSGTFITQNEYSRLNRASATFNLGKHVYSNTAYENKCLMSHVYFIDGASYGTYSASDFGEFDTDSGEWKIKTSPTISSYGANGFLVLKDGATITDQSPNSNDFTASGSITATKDCPSNVFNTFNPLIRRNSDLTLANGNTTLTSANSQWLGTMTHIPLFKGKYYYECKYHTGHNIKLSIVGHKNSYNHFSTQNQSYGDYNDNGYGYQFNNSGTDYLSNNNTTPAWSGGLSSNSGNKIFMVAFDLDSGKIWYGADGTWFNDASGYTGNPSTGAYPHQTITATHLTQTPFIVTGSVEGNGATANWNFGNGVFGTTSVSSAQNPNSGDTSAIFEYTPPTDFQPISTKGINA